ncbi:AAA family ATPase [Nocardia brasiliensis]|uniref:AAA family ATPase n=1 Tax=Nocardia brasiliensis TaxID=37326 RepID=UPI00366C2DAC
MAADNHTAAGEAFQTAINLDPSAADAWLGLHAAGLRKGEAIKAILQFKHSFGTLRTKFSTPLESRFDIGLYVSVRLESDRDLWYASVAELLNEERLDLAWQVMSNAKLDSDQTRFLFARYAFLKRDWALVLKSAHGIDDAFLRDESQLYVALALILEGVLHEALDVLTPLPHALNNHPRFQAEIAFARGLVYEGLNKPEKALRQFQSAYRYNPEYPGVAERAKANTGTSTTSSMKQEQELSHPPPDADGKDLADTVISTDREALLSEAMTQLDDMVGLTPVKRQIRTLEAQLRMSALRKAEGLSAAPSLHHFVFAGPPGTGKTTVARIIGKIFAGLGLLNSGHVVETQRVDLVGRHLGETAIKTTKVIDSALDGVLFVDEAYALVNSGYSNGDAFGTEAVQVLLKRAEDDRHRLVIVLAGYPEEMTELLAVNPGLASRFTTRVDFPAFTQPELIQIARSTFDSQGDALTELSADALASCCKEVVDAGLVNRLGNGRFVRELCRKAAAQRDLWVANSYRESERPSLEEITTLTAADITSAFQALVASVSTSNEPRDRQN